MKNLKIILALSVLTLFLFSTWNSNAQESTISAKIPQEYKTTKKEEASQKLITVKTYNEKYKGYVVGTGYINAKGEAKFSSILFPSNSTTRGMSNEPSSEDLCPEGIRQCYKDCFDHDGLAKILICRLDCIANCLFDPNPVVVD